MSGRRRFKQVIAVGAPSSASRASAAGAGRRLGACLAISSQIASPRAVNACQAARCAMEGLAALAVHVDVKVAHAATQRQLFLAWLASFAVFPAVARVRRRRGRRSPSPFSTATASSGLDFAASASSCAFASSIPLVGPRSARPGRRRVRLVLLIERAAEGGKVVERDRAFPYAVIPLQHAEQIVFHQCAPRITSTGSYFAARRAGYTAAISITMIAATNAIT